MRRFYFDLARELKMTVRELLRRIGSHEITEWKAYFALVNEEIEWERKKAKTGGR